MTSLVLLIALVLGADEVPLVELPSEVKVKPGRLLRLNAKTTGKVVKWVAGDEDCDIIPFPDGKTAIFSSMTPGRHRVYAYTALGDQPSEPAICTILVGDVPPVPPPIPPVPPTPPGPTPPPVPPNPDNPLTAKFQIAFNADPSELAKKLDVKTKLVGFYEAMSEHTADKDVKTLGELLEDYQKVRPTLLPEVLTEMRKLVGGEVAVLIGADSAPDRLLIAAFRQQLVDGFKRIAKALEAVK